jgi:hypothetical protein
MAKSPTEVTKVCEELGDILDIREIQQSAKQDDGELAVLPPHEQERIRELLKRELPGFGRHDIRAAIKQTYIDAYEAVQRKARQYFRDYCERHLQEASSRLVETNELKKYVENLIANKFIAPAHPAVVEIKEYSDTESPTRLYSFFLRLFSEKKWFPRTTYASGSREFFAEAELLLYLATAVWVDIKGAIEYDDAQDRMAEGLNHRLCDSVRTTC